MSIHYNLYESLGIDRDWSTGKIGDELKERLEKLRNDGVSEYDPRYQETNVALGVLGDDAKRSVHDERLDDPLAPRMGIPELRTLASTGSLGGADRPGAAPGAGQPGASGAQTPGASGASQPSAPSMSGGSAADDTPTVVGGIPAYGAGPSSPEPDSRDSGPTSRTPDSGPSSYPGPSYGAPQQSPQQPQQQAPQHGSGYGAPQFGPQGHQGGQYQQSSADQLPSSGPQPSVGPAGAVPAHSQGGQHSPAGQVAAGQGQPDEANPDFKAMLAVPPLVKALAGVLAGSAVVAFIAFLTVTVMELSNSLYTSPSFWVINIPAIGIMVTASFLIPRVLKGRDNGLLIPLAVTGVVFALFTLMLSAIAYYAMEMVALILLGLAQIAVVVLAFLPETRAWLAGTWTPGARAPKQQFPQQQQPQQPQQQFGGGQYGAPQQQYGAQDSRYGSQQFGGGQYPPQQHQQ